ncbi:ATP-binding protein [Nocardia iowensis]|uniref:histidine kinase n=1 Tax=Nocardia iowensis TaxID=204891 RepID=A0ABX8RW10_NOCIO|nr:ATP-binding protein [Nocardia iowensis]QXN93849.1 nitrate- and nitrite sensing domain-containing protein [Nocardia iowensis]
MAGIVRPRTIGGQLTRILALALILVLALLGVTVFREVSDYRESNDTVKAVSLALSVQDLTNQIQRELGLSNGLLGGDNRLQQPLLDQRGKLDSALGVLTAAAAADAPGADQVRAALGQLNLLANTRTQIDSRRVSRQVVFQFYTDAVSALNRLALGLDQARDPQIQRGLQALYALGAAKEEVDKERGFLNGVFTAGRFNGGEYQQFMEIRSTKLAGLAAFSRYATKSQQAKLDAAMLSDNATRAEQSENIAIASSDGPLVREVDPMTWWTQMSSVLDEQRTVQQAVGEDVQARAEDLRNAAATKLIGFIVAAVIAIAAMITLVITSVRAIVRPLAALAGEADDVASRRLPEVIEAWSRADDSRPEAPAPVQAPPGASTEIAAVAGALDRVQTTAFELASQQALVRRNTTESMANLARRNQNLVRRQLGLISEFEREELDPKGLSNLFELDHLATRMRRNAESLLVLVGEASPRRWAQPIALSDVIRAGLSEVDDYRRVVLRRVDDVLITGAVVSELAHMLAELIENGLAFSPPDLEVEIYGRRVPQGYLLAVVDHGVGMPHDQLAQSNARLRGEQDFIVAPTRYLGHYVVGRLAERLGIAVELNVSPVSGIVARMSLPLELLVQEQDKRPAAVQAKISGTGLERSWGADSETNSVAALESGPSSNGSSVSTAEILGSTAPDPIAPSMRGPAHAAPTVSASERNGASHGSVTDDPRTGPQRTVPRSEPQRHDATGPAHSTPDSGPPTSAYSQFVSTPPVYEDRLVTDTGTMWRLPESHGAQGEINGAAAAPSGPRTTRNGLVKRNKKSRTAGTAPGTESRRDTTGTTERPDRAPIPERSPEETRSMLSSFRAGHERGAPPAPSSTRPYVGARDHDTRADDTAPNQTIAEENR